MDDVDMLGSSTTHVNNTSRFVSVPLTRLSSRPAVKSAFRGKIQHLQSAVSFVRCLKTVAVATPAAACASILCVLHLPSSQQLLLLRLIGRRCQDALVDLLQPLQLQLRLTSLSKFKAGWENIIIDSAAALSRGTSDARCFNTWLLSCVIAHTNTQTVRLLCVLIFWYRNRLMLLIAVDMFLQILQLVLQTLFMELEKKLKAKH